MNGLWSKSVLTAVAELRGGAALEAAAHLRALEGPWAAERLTQVEKRAFDVLDMLCREGMADPLPYESDGSVKNGRLTFGPSGKRGRHQRTFRARLLRRREAQAGRENMRSGIDRDTLAERTAEKGAEEEGKGDEQGRLEEDSEEEAPAFVEAAGKHGLEEDDEEEGEEAEEEKEARPE